MGLFDFIFNRKKTPLSQPAGTTGVTSFAGKLVSFENSPDLQGTQLYTTLSNMVANCCVAGAAVRYYQNLIAGTSWSVEPKEGTGAEGERAAELVRTGLFEADMTTPWSTVVKKQALYRMYGFSLHEWTMRKRKNDGVLVFADVSHRPQQTIQFWDIDDKPGNGDFRGVVQRPILWGDYYYIQRERLFYSVDNSLTDAPDGVGVLRHVVEHIRRLKRYEQLEGFAYETDLRGVPVAKIPYRSLEKYAEANNKSAAWIAGQVRAMESFVENHIKSPYLGVSIDSSPYMTDAQNPTISNVPQWALELLTGDASGLAEIGLVVERINREIARVLGMEFMLLGGDGKGSLALSRDKTSMFASVLEATLHELSWFAVHDLVYPLLRMNGIDPELYAPQVQPDPIATERIEVTVDALSKLAQAGAILMPDDPAINQIRSRLHLADQPKLAPEIIASKIPGRTRTNPDDGSIEVDVSDLGDDPKNPKGDSKEQDPKGNKRRSSFRQQRGK